MHYICYINSTYIGLNFWRASKRKIFAIPKPRGVKGHRGDEDSDDSSSGEDVKWRAKFSKQLETISAELRSILEVNKFSPIPIRLSKSLSEVFKCKICHKTPMQPPLIYARCCRSIVGCEVCVNQWYEGEEVLTKACPLCVTGRRYNDMQQIHGFDNLTITIKSMFSIGHQ